MRRFRNAMMSAFLGTAAAVMMTMPVFAIDSDIVIIHTNDTHCGIEENLGFEGVAAYEKQMKALTLRDFSGRRRRDPGSAGGDFVRGRIHHKPYESGRL